MARVYSSSPPSLRATAASGPPARRTSEQREVFTIWMKSLVLNGSGCTVYDSKGRIVYRVDNYTSCSWRCRRDVFLMDLRGNIILKILNKKLGFGKWEGYKWRGQEQEPRAWFNVRRPRAGFFRGGCPSSTCEFRSDDTGRAMLYRIDDERAASSQACCRIVDDASGLVAAEVRRKLTATGVALGDDVLTLVVEPNVDHSLIMGLVLVHGLMNHTM